MKHASLRHSLKGKLLLAGMLLQTVLLLLFYLVVTEVLRESAERALKTSAKTISQSVNLSVAPYAFERRFDVLSDFFSELISESEEGLRYIVILDEKQKVLLSVGLRGQALPAPSADAGHAIAAGIYHVKQPVLLSGNQVGEVRFGIATGDISAVLQKMLNIALAVSIAGLLLTAWVLMYFGQRLQARLDPVIQAMQDIVGGDYTRRIPEQGRDELAHLSHQFNHMVSAVETRDKKFAAVMNAAPIPMALFRRSSEGALMRIDRNLAAIRCFGPLEDFKMTHRPYISMQEKQRLMQALALHDALPPQEIDMILADGTRHPFMLYAESFVVDGERYTTLVAMDICDLRETQNRLRELNTALEQRVEERTAELAEKNQTLATTLSTLQQTQEKLIQSEKLSGLGRMVAGVAHELNTPLGSALTVASTMLDKQQDFEQQVSTGLRRSALQQYLSDNRQAGELLLKNIERAASLVQSFKAIATEDSAAEPGLMMLDTLLQQVMRDTQPRWQSMGVILNIHITTGLQLTCAYQALYRVLMQLVDNALVHGLSGISAPELSVSADIEDSPQCAAAARVRIIIADNGHGIAAGDLGRIFDPFFTTRFGQGSNGLGLHMVYNLVSGVLGGEIHAESQPGQGTKMILSLPQHTDSEA